MAGLPGSELAAGFQTTHWEDLQAARTADLGRRQDILNELAKRYWAPVYWYLRARHLPHADALDVTQDFFIRVVLEHHLFARADRNVGRFRTFLLTCLENHLRSWHRHENAHRRCPEGLVLSMERWKGSAAPTFDLPSPDSNPEALFHWKWAATLLDRVLSDLGDSCRRAGLGEHFAIFEERVVRPTLFGEDPTPLEELAARYGLAVKQVANRTETIRRRFRKLLLEEVGLTITDQSQAEEEVHDLLACLRRKAT